MRAYRLLRPLLFRLPSERSHALALGTLARIQGTAIERLLASRYTVRDPRLAQTVFGLEFENPLGIAAGLDKNAVAPNALAALGFGHVEVGGITGLPQAGNDRPRLFRLPQDRALINRMGFNNEGADAIGERLDRYDDFRVPIGINIGKSKRVTESEAPGDYRYTYERVADAGDYFVINVSSPNTPGLRSLQRREALEAIIDELQAAGAAPLLVKFSPDLAKPALEEALELVHDRDLDGIIATNTTTNRPEGLSHPNRAEEGGLSGDPLEETATELISFIARRTDRPIIGVGGVSDADGAYAKIRNGASLVQLYTGLIYEGPSLARRINRGLLARLERDGFDSVAAAVGVDA